LGTDVINKVDLEKRKRIMKRSIALGHCICNPKQGCPCNTFKEKYLCPCAGERPEQAVGNVKLTALVEKAGCASKINQNDLKRVLAGLPEQVCPNVLVGTNTCDDAGVYKLDDHTALVQTVDVFSPIVDDPYTFGEIAAANSLSDVYAMGGKPISALSIVGFPVETVDHQVLTQMLRGGLEKMREAGVAVVGGHSINDKEPKFGYAVTGTIDPNCIITNDKARPGDIMVLTKPLGVGVISFAGQMGMASESALESAAHSMSLLNKYAAEAMLEVGVNSATDVTGFGLVGHLGEMARQSGVTAEVWADHVPVFDEVLDYISRGIISGGIERNTEHGCDYLTVSEGVSPEMVYVLHDPQTSGGLLIAVPQQKSRALLDCLRRRGVSSAAIIGRVVSESEGRIVVKNNNGEAKMDEVPTNDCCCCGNGDSCSETIPSIIAKGNAKAKFGEFMSTVSADGAISSRTKELIAISLSVLSKCEPCVKIHIEEARSLGVSEEEISEAVWMAISFGGAPTMMFYKTLAEKLK
jgi:selenide,water dikinase